MSTAPPCFTRSRQYQGKQGLLAAVAVVLGASLATGCSSGGEEKKSAPTAGAEHPSSPSSTAASAASPSADEQAKVKAEVLRVYRGYWDEQIKAYAKASPKGTNLDKFAFDKALGEANQGMVSMQVHGNVMTGRPTRNVKAIEVNQARQKATITDCVDVSKWVMINKTSGKPVALPKERLTRFVTTVSARTVGDRWMIVATQQHARSC